MGIVRLRFSGAGGDVGAGPEPRWRGGRGEWRASGVHLEATAGHDAVDVGVKGEGLRPGVEDGDGAGQRSQPTPAYVMERFEGGLG